MAKKRKTKRWSVAVARDQREYAVIYVEAATRKEAKQLIERGIKEANAEGVTDAFDVNELNWQAGEADDIEQIDGLLEDK